MKDMVEIPHDPPAADQPAASPSEAAFSELRSEMVEKAILARGVRSELFSMPCAASRARHFLPKELREFAYDDCPLPIEGGADDFPALYRRIHDRGAGARGR